MLNWPEIFQEFIVAIVAGIVVSFSFLLILLKFMRPKFKISKYICANDNEYLFKIINNSIYHAFDVQIELFEMEPYAHTRGSVNVNIRPISLETKNITSIPRFHKKTRSDDPYNLFALLILTKQDLKTFMAKKGSYIEMRVTVRHGLTGLASTIVQQFDDNDVIREGHKFCYGDQEETIPSNHLVK